MKDINFNYNDCLDLRKKKLLEHKVYYGYGDEENIPEVWVNILDYEELTSESD